MGIAHQLPLFSQSHQIGHDILDLLGGQDGLAAPRLADTLKPLESKIRRHDGRRIESRCIDQPEPQLAFRPAAAGAGEVRCQVTLEFLLRKWPGMTENAGVLASDDNGAATL